MKKGNSIWQYMAESADLQGEDIPGQSVVEISGDSRVLIEHHKGVCRYSQELIGVNVKLGTVCISGHGLELALMTKEQLVIRGRIASVTLQRRK